MPIKSTSNIANRPSTRDNRSGAPPGGADARCESTATSPTVAATAKTASMTKATALLTSPRQAERSSAWMHIHRLASAYAASGRCREFTKGFSAGGMCSSSRSSRSDMQGAKSPTQSEAAKAPARTFALCPASMSLRNPGKYQGSRLSGCAASPPPELPLLLLLHCSSRPRSIASPASSTAPLAVLVLGGSMPREPIVVPRQNMQKQVNPTSSLPALTMCWPSPPMPRTRYMSKIHANMSGQDHFAAACTVLMQVAACFSRCGESEYRQRSPSPRRTSLIIGTTIAYSTRTTTPGQHPLDAIENTNEISVSVRSRSGLTMPADGTTEML
mmetsp:Transcript_72161/g.191442  ORF Transcript_72161/g.191442 Transcript_72161/m.191442 type:complete len:329 (-) Transcript_72161:131-1117(-)